MFLDGLKRTKEMREEIDELLATLGGLARHVCRQEKLSNRSSVQREIRLAENIKRSDFLSVTVRRKFGEERCVQTNAWSAQTLDMVRVWQVHAELYRILGLFLVVFPEIRGTVSIIQKVSKF